MERGDTLLELPQLIRLPHALADAKRAGVTVVAGKLMHPLNRRFNGARPTKRRRVVAPHRLHAQVAHAGCDLFARACLRPPHRVVQRVDRVKDAHATACRQLPAHRVVLRTRQLTVLRRQREREVEEGALAVVPARAAHPRESRLVGDREALHVRPDLLGIVEHASVHGEVAKGERDQRILCLKVRKRRAIRSTVQVQRHLLKRQGFKKMLLIKGKIVIKRQAVQQEALPLEKIVQPIKLVCCLPRQVGQRGQRLVWARHESGPRNVAEPAVLVKPGGVAVRSFQRVVLRRGAAWIPKAKDAVTDVARLCTACRRCIANRHLAETHRRVRLRKDFKHGAAVQPAAICIWLVSLSKIGLVRKRNAQRGVGAEILAFSLSHIPTVKYHDCVCPAASARRRAAARRRFVLKQRRQDCGRGHDPARQDNSNHPHT
mmetsp:Transcript_49271/g.106724  ORF Transcript_49271/g.106724 Transcript_49271/m.106724 type:complete len:431 (+) Transcript_49271:546-1838(+)